MLIASAPEVGGGGGQNEFLLPPQKKKKRPPLKKKKSSKGVKMVCIFNPKEHNNNKNLN